MAACPTCGFDNPSGFRFCGSCAAPLGLTCPNCGADVPSGFRFCGQCAAPIGQPRAEPEREEPVAERRHVSVLFADLVGFTTLSESRDPEDVRELLSRYFDTGRAVVDRYGGVVEKFIGDAVMAVWGTPIVYEDDAERAVRAGLDLVEAVAALGREVGAPELTARVGVLTGEAAVTLGATGQGMVAGDLVNTASRLQSAAEPGTVLVGESTCRAAARAIAFEEAGAFTPKGKSEPMRTWRAVRVIARRLGAGREAMLEAPFVGRGEELRLLKELLQATMRERKVRLVSVTGIGGIGKSRLAREFMKYLDGLKEAVFWHQGRSPAYGEGVAFWALGEMVRMRAGIAESDEPAEARFKLGACVTETIGDPEERSWVEPRLAHLLGLEEQAPGEREELFAAWRCFFERIAEHGPAVMVFEDLQWADQGLLDFIDSILEWTRAQPILLLTLARPELSQKRPDWGAARRSFTAMHLEPLPDAAMAELVEGFVRGLPPQDVAGILERAEGVPLYAVETIRMLADRGVLHAEEDGYRAVGSIGEIDVPGSLHALIAARLDALPPPDRALVQDASVLGKSFTLEGLAAIAGPVTEDQLRELIRREFLVRDADPRSPERGQYAFVQSLIREVAYGTLARRDRRAKHLAAAGHFESRDEGELAAVVATHYLEAYRASPQGPDGEAVAASARDWLVRAARRSMSLGSPLPALAYAKEALTIASDDRDRASLLDLAGEAAFRAARREESIELWTEARARYRAAGDHPAAGLATSKMVQPYLWLSRPREVIGSVIECVDALGDADVAARAELYASLVTLYNAIGESALAVEWAERALPLAERIDDSKLFGRAIVAKAWALFNEGRHREAEMLARGRLAMLRPGSDLVEQAEILLTLGNLLWDDDPRRGLEVCLDAAATARRAGHSSWERASLSNAAEGAIDLGEFDRARAVIDQLRQMGLEDVSDRASVAFSEALLAAITGDAAAAEASLEETAEWAGAAGFVQARSWYLRVRGVAALTAGDVEGAYRDGTEAVAIDPAGINGGPASILAARAAVWLGDAERVRHALADMEVFRGRRLDMARLTASAGLAAMEGRTEEAADGYARAAEAVREMESPLDLALSQLDRVITLGTNDVDGKAAAEEARSVFERLGATPFLQRLDETETREATAPR